MFRCAIAVFKLSTGVVAVFYNRNKACYFYFITFIFKPLDYYYYYYYYYYYHNDNDNHNTNVFSVIRQSVSQSVIMVPQRVQRWRGDI